VIRFDRLDRWYTDLTLSEQEEINQLKSIKAPIPLPRILPLWHGNTMSEQLLAGRSKFLSRKEPFSLIRLGDFELGLLGALYFPFGWASNGLHTMMTRAGYANNGSIALRRDLIEAVRRSPLVGVLENWDTQRAETAALMAMLDCPVPCPRAVEIHLPYSLLVDGTLFSWLAGRRVLLIGNLAPRLFEAWRRPAFHRAYEHFGPSSKVKIVDAIQTSSREDGGAWKDFHFALKCAKRMDYDVALIASGAMAKPLAYRIWRMGRTALDVGFVFDALLREREDARVCRPVLKDASFPDVSW
jgi:hypothetical protein